jgi:hypothetical protein
MLARLDIETWEIGEGGMKGGWEVEWVSGGRGMDAFAEFWGPYVCLGAFLFS